MLGFYDIVKHDEFYNIVKHDEFYNIVKQTSYGTDSIYVQIPDYQAPCVVA